MKALVTLLVLLLGTACNAQVDFHRTIPLGGREVGFFDALVYDDDGTYEEFGYSGAAPRFVQVWYPLTAPATGGFLTYGALRERSVPDPLGRVYSELCARMDESLVAYDLTETVGSHEPIDYAPHTVEEVLEAVKSCPTRSRRARPEGPLDVPVIVYHHGSQGLSDENFVMAESFASKGYAFVSANFHLPRAGQPYGLHEGITDDDAALRAVIRFARALTTNDTLFFIGHSWGAQVGWCRLHEPGLAQAFVSMETTLEGKTDLDEIRDKWPFVHEALTTRGRTLPIPVLHFACTGSDGPFTYFVGRCATDMYQLSARRPFEHESYTATYLLRGQFRDRFPQPDSDLLQQQLELHAEHLRAIEAFFHSVRAGEPFPEPAFTEDFRVRRIAGSGVGGEAGQR